MEPLSKCCSMPLKNVPLPESHAHSSKIVCSKCDKYQRWGRSEKTQGRIRDFQEKISRALERHTCGKAHDFLVSLQSQFASGKLSALSPSQHTYLESLTPGGVALPHAP